MVENSRWTEIQAGSDSSINDDFYIKQIVHPGQGSSINMPKRITAYLKERLPLVMYLPLSLIFSVTALLMRPGNVYWGIELSQQIPLFYFLIAQFRLRDDLFSLPEDRVTHPNRVLSKLSSIRSFVGLCFVLFALNTCFLYTKSGGLSVVTFVGLSIVYELAYFLGNKRRKALPKRTPGTFQLTAHYHLLLLKYPFFVFIVAGVWYPLYHPKLLLIGLILYLTFCIYETLDDPTLQALRKVQYLALLECFLFINSVWLSWYWKLEASGKAWNSGWSLALLMLTPSISFGFQMLYFLKASASTSKFRNQKEQLLFINRQRKKWAPMFFLVLFWSLLFLYFC